MKISFSGPNGSGKTSVVNVISSLWGLPKLSCGDFVRRKDQFPWVAELVGDYDVYSGALLEPEIVVQIMQRAASEATSGFILDGSPRTLFESEFYYKTPSLTPDIFVLFTTPLEISQQRLSQRWIHPASGRLYHDTANPPMEAGIDDYTKEPLVKRADDTPEIIEKRYRIYLEQTMPGIMHAIHEINQRKDAGVLLEVDDSWPDTLPRHVESAMIASLRIIGTTLQADPEGAPRNYKLTFRPGGGYVFEVR